MRQSPRDKYHITVWRARWTLGRRGQLVRFSLDRFGFPLRKQPPCFLVEHANNVFINLDEFSGVFFIGSLFAEIPPTFPSRALHRRTSLVAKATVGGRQEAPEAYFSAGRPKAQKTISTVAMRSSRSRKRCLLSKSGYYAN